MRRTQVSLASSVVVIVVALATSGLAHPAMAQEAGRVTGTVVQENTLEPLGGAQVVVVGTGLGAAAGSDGRYLIANVPAGEVLVRVEMLGYGQSEQRITVPAGGDAVADFALSSSAINLEELVVTGAGVVTEKKRLGQSVATVSSEQWEDAPAGNVMEVLQGRIPGLVANALGEVGAGAPIRVRGTVSLTQRNGPLIYVDGVRVSNDREGFASITTSALSHLNPANIGRIEVLKGAAAATLYGTEASSGVIQIFTKRGMGGSPQWDLKISQGISQTPLDRIPANVVYDSETGQLLSNEPARSYVELGHSQEYNLSVRGGGGGLNYYAAGWYRNADGSLPTNGLSNRGARVNLTLTPMEGMQARVGLNLIDNEVQVPYPSWGLVGEFVLADPRRVDENRPFGELFHTIPGVLAYENLKTTDRSTLGAEINYQWAGNLSSHFMLGYHQASDRELLSVPPGADARNPTGWRQLTDGDRSETTLELTTTWEAAFLDNLASTLTVGAQSYWEHERWNASGVEDFPGPGVTTLRGGATVFTVDEFFQEVINAGVFAQEQLGLNDRLFLTAGIRVDGNSTFGENFGFQAYPRAGLSWVVSEEPFWNFDALDLLRLRGAWGTSGLQPGVYDALRTWETQSLLSNVSVVLPQGFGNPDLKPERSTEFEVGANIGLLDNRLALDATYFWQKTADAILARERPPSSGFLDAQLVNIGEMESQGFEAAVDFMAIDGAGLRWQLHGSLATLDQVVTDLGGIPGFKTSSDTRRWNFIREGYQPGAVIGPVLDPDDPYSLSVPVADFNDLNQLTPNTIQTASGGDSLIFVGNQAPTLTGALGTTLGLPRYGLSLNILVRAEGGFVVFDETNLIRATVGITREASEFQQELADANTSPARRQEIAEEWARTNPFVHSNWVQDGDYVRLQNVALTWDLPGSLTNSLSVDGMSITLAGRNLLLLTGYDGIIDPGSSSTAGNDFGANVDYFGAPSPRQFELSIQTTF